MTSPLKVTIVEDDKVVQNILVQRVKKLGYSVISQFGSGEEVLSQIGESLPNIVLMDINLSGKIDGIETAFRIQSQYNLPIVFVSGNRDDETVRRVNTISGAEYVVKPITDDDLRIAIRLALDKYRFINKLKTRDALYKLLFDQFFGGIIATNMEGIITYVNESARSLIKWNAPVNDNTHFREIVTIVNDSGVPLENAFERVKQEKKICWLPPNSSLIRFDKTKVLVIGNVSPMVDPDATMKGMIMVIFQMSRPTYLEFHGRPID
ncbi:MAG: response regulator [Methanoregula sp.]|nr:response regulator [Methanoregula sp.]